MIPRDTRVTPRDGSKALGLALVDPLEARSALGRWAAWYEQAIPEADGLYDERLAELREEGER